MIPVLCLVVGVAMVVAVAASAAALGKGRPSYNPLLTLEVTDVRPEQYHHRSFNH